MIISWENFTNISFFRNDTKNYTNDYFTLWDMHLVGFSVFAFLRLTSFLQFSY